jgi:hypothetical protein
MITKTLNEALTDPPTSKEHPTNPPLLLTGGMSQASVNLIPYTAQQYFYPYITPTL